MVITHEYDRLGRLTRRRQGATVLEECQYSALGQLTNRVDAAGAHAWRYDALGRLRTNTTPAGALYYGYDDAGRLTALGTGTAGGVTNQYQYDALGRLTNVVDLRLATAAKNTGYGYDGAGNLQWVKYNPNGVTNLYRYDAQNRLTNLVWKLGSADRAGFHYTLGLAGNRLTLLETNNGAVRSYSWTYDDTYRLLSEQITGTAPTGTLGYTYDDVGNRLSRTGSFGGLTNQPAVSYDLRDQLDNDTTPSTASTFFDVRGNATGYFGAWQYDWAGRLTNYNGGTVKLWYGAEGNRLKKEAGGVTTWYLVATVNPTGYPQVVEERTGTTPTTLVRAYTYGLDLVSQQRDGSPANVSFYGTDGLGSVKFLLNTSGGVTDTYTYDAWGGLIASSGPTPNSYRYAGEQWDPDLGLYCNRARYLHPGYGRFWTRDTYEGSPSDPLSLHAYLYGHADPVNRIDPSGHFAELNSTLTTSAKQYGLQTGGAVVAVSARNAARSTIAKAIGSSALISSLLLSSSDDTDPSSAGQRRSRTTSIYRGIPRVDNEKYRLALVGIAKPRGARLDIDALRKHVLNEDVDSGVTSWTSIREVAKRFSGHDGIILEVDYLAVIEKFVPRPPVPKFLDEHEILLKGIITAKPTQP